MSLIELLVALTIFAVVSAGFAVGMGSALGLARNNRNRSIAANLASGEMDAVRSMPFQDVVVNEIETLRTVDQVVFTITRRAEWVSEGTTEGPCDGDPGTALEFKRVTVDVSWPNMAGVAPVQSQTILSPPVGNYDTATGSLSIRVSDRNGAAGTGHVVNIVGPSGTYTEPLVDGCAFFAALPRGSYIISLDTEGYVDGQGVTTPSQSAVVSTGTLTSVEFDYDQASALWLTPIGLTGYPAPGDIDMTIANTGLSLGYKHLEGPPGTATCTSATVTSNADALVSEESSDSNYGSLNYLGIRSNDSRDIRSFVKFPLPTTPSGCAIGAATLRLSTVSYQSGRTLKAYRVASTWSENSVEWGNMPSTVGGSSSTASGSGWVQWNVVNQVNAMYAGSNNGFMLRDDAEDGAGSGFSQYYSSRQGTPDPELVITYVDAANVCPNGTVYSSADAVLPQDQSTTNFGTSSTSYGVRSQSGSANRRSMVGFTLPSVPAGCTLTGATLRMYASSAASGRTLQAYQAATGWSEDTVTWSNQPATTGTASTTTSGSGWREWSVLNQIQSMYSGTNTGFVVRDSSENAGSSQDQAMHPREAANDPELELTFSAPPPSPPVSPGPVVGDGLFPYAGGYHAWAGTCLDNDPEGQIPGDGGPYYPAGQRETPVLATPG
ncbi:MAG TPA: DNRLRE domain-containing protein, partial [Actinomycetota bacterium]|nr:DNRLRE domain-containing protein [Actinomycetota bacterium]